MKVLKIVAQLMFFLFPWPIRRLLLGVLLGIKCEKTSRIGFSIILSRSTLLRSGAYIGHFTFVNQIDRLEMGPNSKIGNRNWITGSSALLKRGYASTPDRKCEFIVGEHTRVTAEHYFDCNGGVYIGRFTTVAGLQSQFLSHGIDINDSVQRTSSIHVGDYCFVGTRCILLMGSALPSFSVLGAGSILNKNYNERYRLYAGNPARELKELTPESRYFVRLEGNVR